MLCSPSFYLYIFSIRKEGSNVNKPHRVKCDICGVEFMLTDSTYRNRIKNHPVDTKFYCKEHKRLGMSIDRQLFMSKLPDEEKERRRKESSERAKQQWASYDDEKRKKIHEIFSNAQKRRIENMTEEELQDYKNSRREIGAKGIAGRTESFYEKRSQLSKEMWANRTKEERDTVRAKQSAGLKRYIESLSKEEREKRNARLRKIGADAWDNLTDERKSQLVHKSLSSRERNNQNIRFEKEFSNAGLSFTFQNEYSLWRLLYRGIAVGMNRTLSKRIREKCTVRKEDRKKYSA